jgi:hypothetical protein
MDEEMLNMMAMEEMMGGAPPAGMGMDPMAGGGDSEMVPVMVPAWTVPAVEELVSILSESDAMGMDPAMAGGMPPMGSMGGGMPF